MAGALILVDEFTISSPVSAVTIGGGSSGSSSYNFAIDSTYDVYQLVYNNVTTSTDGRNVAVRVTKSGTADATANYDYAYKVLNSTASFSNANFDNENEWTYMFVDNVGTGTSEKAFGTSYLFNFHNASEYSFITADMVEMNLTPIAKGNVGGGVHTVASASDGLYFFDDAGGNIESGTFKLYGLRK